MSSARKPSIATISIYPNLNQTHLSVSALAGYTKSLLNSLPIDDKKRHLVLANKVCAQTEQYFDNDIMVYRCWSKATLRYIWDLLVALKKFPSLKVVHLQHEFNQFGGATTIALIPVLCLITRFILKKKLVLSLHEVLDPKLFSREFVKENFIDFWPTAASFLIKNYYRLLAYCSHLILVHHQEARDTLQFSMGIRGNIKILPHGVASPTNLISQTEARKRLQISEGKNVVLFFGMMDKRKGIEIAIDAFEKLNDDFLLLVVGGKSDRLKNHALYLRWFSDMLKKMSSLKNIRYEGFVECESIENYFRAADRVLLPYTQPGSSSGVLALSLTYERPWIATKFVRPELGQNSTLLADAKAIQTAINEWDAPNSISIPGSNYKALWNWTRIASLLSQHYEKFLNDSFIVTDDSTCLNPRLLKT